jgi:hypothetical protein
MEGKLFVKPAHDEASVPEPTLTRVPVNVAVPLYAATPVEKLTSAMTVPEYWPVRSPWIDSVYDWVKRTYPLKVWRMVGGLRNVAVHVPFAVNVVLA